LVRKPEGRRPRGKPRRRWKDVKIDLKETGWESVDWINLVKGRDQWWTLVKKVENFRVT
jgi:hypothetical protein